MASREELEALRELAVKRHRAASQKVSRLKRKKGVDVAGKREDPRTVDPERFKRMNSIQLGAHIARLDKFVSRETQFAAGPRGALLTGQLLAQNQRLQAAINRQRDKNFDAVKDIHIPSFGTKTVNGKSVPITAEMQAAMKPVHPVTGNPSSRAPHIHINIGPKSFANDKQLRKSNKELEARLISEAQMIEKRDRKIMSTFMKTIAKINRSPELKEVRSIYKDLTPGQFEFMWNYTKFSDISSFDYEIAKSKLHDPKSLSQFDAAFDTQIREMNKIIKEVKNLAL